MTYLHIEDLHLSYARSSGRSIGDRGTSHQAPTPTATPPKYSLPHHRPSSSSEPSARSQPSQALRGVDLKVNQGEFLCLLGANGSGKTSLLRCIAGFERPTAGSISIDGQKVFHATDHTITPSTHHPSSIFVSPERRGIGMVFQNLAIFPHLTARDNIIFGLNHLSSTEKQSRLRELTELFRLNATALSQHGHELSGGLKQRVALARALAPQPKILLLDEPLSSLDPEISLALSRDLHGALRARNITAVMVSHNRYQAFELAHRVAIMLEGRILQHGSPPQIYRYPANHQIAHFLGDHSFVRCIDQGDHFETPFGRLLPREIHDLRPQPPTAGPAWLALRAESLEVVPSETDTSSDSLSTSSKKTTSPLRRCLEFQILDQSYHGHYTLLRIQIPSGEILDIRHHHLDQPVGVSGNRVRLCGNSFCVYPFPSSPHQSDRS